MDFEAGQWCKGTFNFLYPPPASSPPLKGFPSEEIWLSNAGAARPGRRGMAQFIPKQDSQIKYNDWTQQQNFRRSQPDVGLVVGDRVRAKERFLPLEGRPIFQNMEGVVQNIYGDGEAEIRFDKFGVAIVCHRDLHRLDIVQAEPTELVQEMEELKKNAQALPGGMIAGQRVVSLIDIDVTLARGDVGIVRGPSTSGETARVNVHFPNKGSINLLPSQFEVEIEEPNPPENGDYLDLAPYSPTSDLVAEEVRESSSQWQEAQPCVANRNIAVRYMGGFIEIPANGIYYVDLDGKVLVGVEGTLDPPLGMDGRPLVETDPKSIPVDLLGLSRKRMNAPSSQQYRRPQSAGLASRPHNHPIIGGTRPRSKIGDVQTSFARSGAPSHRPRIRTNSAPAGPRARRSVAFNVSEVKSPSAQRFRPTPMPTHSQRPRTSFVY
jgi:hypothetical protein